MNDYLATTPFDLYELSLFRLVAKHGSFTRAAQEAGLTQSAITRQIQGVESSLGVTLLDRTTRSMKLTAAGEFLFHESAQLIGSVDAALCRLKENFAGARKVIRVGVSRSVGLSHLPGLFHANLRLASKIGYHVSNQTSDKMISNLEANEIDVGVLCPPPRLPKTLCVTHRFKDAFTLIVPTALAEECLMVQKSKAKRTAWLTAQSWLLIDEQTNTGKQLHRWMTHAGLKVEPAMQLDSFDLIINLVSLGMGVSFVPIRALALYGRKSTWTRLRLPDRFERDLVVVMRRHRKAPEHLTGFVKNILF